jgi:ATP-dependent helicase/nuclease subunit B
MSRQVVVSASAQARLEHARRWLAARGAAEPVLVVAASLDAASDLLRTAALERGALFGWQRATLTRVAAELAGPALLAAGLVPAGRLAAEATAARVAEDLAGAGALGRYTAARTGPGFARAACATFAELRDAGVSGSRLDALAPELGTLTREWEAALAQLGLADRARVIWLAAEAARTSAHPWLGAATLLLDVPVETRAERALVEALLARAAVSLATVVAGDASWHAELALEDVGGAAPAPTSLARLQRGLFEESAPEPAELDASVAIFSAPGESRECVEIARRVIAAARAGTPFDRIAILLRSPEEYRAHLAEALGRAGVPVHFARGAVRPDPAGRAFLALLACAAEGLSARRFAEYLSLAQVPDATPDGGPPPALEPEARFVPADEELVPEAIGDALARAAGAEAAPREELPVGDPDASAVTSGTLRAPRRWEQLLVEASVIGGRERWERRLAGLARELELQLDEVDAGDEGASAHIERQRADLTSLRSYALPLLDALAGLPARASWEHWLDALSALATRALRHPGRVLAALAELAPMAELRDIDLAEVRRVLGHRLLEVAEPPPRVRYGAVYVAPADAARGLAFDVVFVPGLAEKLFPRKICEDPMLLDALRAQLDGSLPTNAERVARERRALRIAAGAARSQLVLSYPRIDLDRSRPRVPSLYALEALRAAEGRLPGFVALSARAEQAAQARVGWPAPARAHDAIDEAEHDLALLERLLRIEGDQGAGTARYLLDANPHLGRALRARARRWHHAWTIADGLVPPPRGEIAAGARESLRAHQLSARSFSPTALEKFSDCPYRFFLHTVHRLAPRGQPEAIDELNPLERGSLVHDTQHELFSQLRELDLLPVRADNLTRAREVLDRALDAIAARYHDDLAPAIERVWQDGIAQIRTDLREWLRRCAEDPSGFVPWRSELAFGLPSRRGRDPGSAAGPVQLDCGIALRGSIDLIERSADGRARVTDHKTGKERVRQGAVIHGGSALQPVLYALVVEKLAPEVRVESGRLYYCTSAGGFTEVSVALDARARAAAELVARTVEAALEEPFLPALPARGACTFCDYQLVCGPYEEQRTRRKPRNRARVRELERLREQR